MNNEQLHRTMATFCTPSRIAYNSKRHQYTGNLLLINFYAMNRIKTYVFDINVYPYTLDINATSIIEAKEKVRNMGYHKAYFVKIKPLFK